MEKDSKEEYETIDVILDSIVGVMILLLAFSPLVAAVAIVVTKGEGGGCLPWAP